MNRGRFLAGEGAMAEGIGYVAELREFRRVNANSFQGDFEVDSAANHCGGG